MDKLFAIHIKPVNVNGKFGFSIDQVSVKDHPVQIVDDPQDLAVLIENLAKYYIKQQEEREASDVTKS